MIKKAREQFAEDFLERMHTDPDSIFPFLSKSAKLKSLMVKNFKQISRFGKKTDIT